MKVAGAGVDLMIRSYRDCHEVLRSHKFAGSAGRPEGRAFLGESVLLVDGEEHRDRRQLYLPLVREPRLQALEATVVVPVLEAPMARHLRPGADGSRPGHFVTLARAVCMRPPAAVICLDGLPPPPSAAPPVRGTGPSGYRPSSNAPSPSGPLAGPGRVGSVSPVTIALASPISLWPGCPEATPRPPATSLGVAASRASWSSARA